MLNKDKIGGHKVPKWEAPADALEEIVGNIQTVSEYGSELQSKLHKQEEAKKVRAMAGLCDKCRLQNCLCNEGQGI